MSLEAGFRIGERDVFPLEGRICSASADQRVEPKAMGVLLELARHPGSVCPRDQLIAAVWPHRFVTDDVLTRCIGQLRRALEDDPRAPILLETIPKRGYRLRGCVRLLETTAADAQIQIPPVKSLIVLPLLNLSRETEDFLVDGITELLIARLAALHKLRVISRTTSMQFKGSRAGIAEITELTHADWVIEGSVVQSGSRLRIVVRLVDPGTDAHAWSADYLCEMQDILPLQDEIVTRIAAAIRVRLGAAPVAAHPLAPELMRDYLKGRHLVGRRTVPDIEAARALFMAVTNAAPDYPAGWASLAESELLLAHYDTEKSKKWVEDCGAHADRALALDPDLGIGLSVRGGHRLFFGRQYEAAAADLQRAVQILPSYAIAMLSLANLCAVRHDFAEANAWLDQALLVDPLNVGINMNVGDHMLLQRRYADAVTALDRTLGLSPDHRPAALRRCWAMALDDRSTAAREQLDAIGPLDDADAPWHEYAALAAGASGDTVTAARHHDVMTAIAERRHLSPWSLARAAAAAQRNDAALAWIETAAQERSSSVPFMRITPAFDALHDDERFRTLAASLGLP